MSHDPNFILTVQINEPYPDFLTWLRSWYSQFEWESPERAVTPDSFIRIKENTLYDVELAQRDPLHYQYEIEVMHWRESDDDSTVMQKQAALAQMFIQDFKARGYSVGLDAPDIEKFL